MNMRIKPPRSWTLVKVCNLASSLQVENNSRIVAPGVQHPSIHKQDFPTADEELVEWARHKFGGVTSFTKVRNLITATMTGEDGEWHRLSSDLTMLSPLSFHSYFLNVFSQCEKQHFFCCEDHNNYSIRISPAATRQEKARMWRVSFFLLPTNLLWSLAP